MAKQRSRSKQHTLTPTKEKQAANPHTNKAKQAAYPHTNKAKQAAYPHTNKAFTHQQSKGANASSIPSAVDFVNINPFARLMSSGLSQMGVMRKGTREQGRNGEVKGGTRGVVSGGRAWGLRRGERREGETGREERIRKWCQEVGGGRCDWRSLEALPVATMGTRVRASLGSTSAEGFPRGHRTQSLAYFRRL